MFVFTLSSDCGDRGGVIGAVRLNGVKVILLYRFGRSQCIVLFSLVCVCVHTRHTNVLLGVYRLYKLLVFVLSSENVSVLSSGHHFVLRSLFCLQKVSSFCLQSPFCPQVTVLSSKKCPYFVPGHRSVLGHHFVLKKCPRFVPSHRFVLKKMSSFCLRSPFCPRNPKSTEKCPRFVLGSLFGLDEF